MNLLVLKLGGSLAESGRLSACLRLVRRARRPVIIVPGGGPFADAVRAAQRVLDFSDEAAHDMALMAMHQTAAALCALEPRLVAAETLEAMAIACRRSRVPVWLPTKLCAGDRRIPRDWSITSDGLAARLAERLGDAEVALVKSCAVRRGASAKALASHGIVDPVFPEIVARAHLKWRVLGPGDERDLARLLDVGRGPSIAGATRRDRDAISTSRPRRATAI